MSGFHRLPASEFIARFPPHSEGTSETWQARYEAAWANDTETMVEIYADMRDAEGWVGPPAVVSWTGRAKDAHYRVLCAVLLDLEVPYLHLPESL